MNRTIEMLDHIAAKWKLNAALAKSQTEYDEANRIAAEWRKAQEDELIASLVFTEEDRDWLGMVRIAL